MTTTPALKRSKDRKVTNSATPSGAVRIANTFGLPAGISCPGQTAVCGKICYAMKLERVYSGVKGVLMHNYELVREADFVTIIMLLDDMISAFERECEKHDALKVFRIHWDGDFFNLVYTKAWAVVMVAHPDVQFWAYTRWAPAAAALLQREIPNLALYFSVDTENAVIAKSLKHTYPSLRLATLADTFAEAKELHGKPAARCPEQTGQIPLISPEGGACVKCGLCPLGKVDVLFSISKR